ncbi:leucine-rich repeat domain-containing protein [Candidatus Latescibacterota bacterium]
MRVCVFIILFISFIVPHSQAYVGDQLNILTTNDTIVRTPDISYNPIIDKYLVVWEEDEGFDKWTIQGRIFNSDGSTASNRIYISTTYNSQFPKVACANSGSWAVVWSQEAAIGGGIAGCRINEDGSCHNYITIEHDFAVIPTAPDIGGSISTDTYLVVYQKENLGTLMEIRGKLFNANTGTVSDDFTYGNSLYHSRQNPSINQRGYNFFVAWEKHDLSSIDETGVTEISIEGLFVSNDGQTPDNTPMALSSESGKNIDPSVASRLDNINEFVIVWGAQSDNNYDIHYAATSSSHIMVDDWLTDTTDIEIRPSVSYTGIDDNYLITYGKADTWEGDWNISGKNLKTDQIAPTEEENIAFTSDNEGSPEGTTIGGADGEVIVTWDRKDGADVVLYARKWQLVEPPSIISVTPTNQPVTSGSGSTTFTVSNTGGGTLNWTASESVDWITTIAPLEGENSGTITVTYLENTTSSPRTGTITIEDSGASNSPQTVTVTQAADLPPSANQDSLALVALYNSTDGPNWTANTNWLTSAPVSEWFGVSVDANEVIKLLDLKQNNLTGSIPPDIENLTNLIVLNLQRNNLTGIIPSEIGSLANLSNLYLDRNDLTGTIPTEISNITYLRGLYLEFNELSGTIPPEICSLTYLWGLNLSGNQLTGSIPSEIGDLSNLEQLELSYNQLTGTIPSVIGNLSNLERLYLSDNQLTGSIPSEIGDLNNLVNLVLFENQLTGSIPSGIFNLINLTFLSLFENQLTGTIPPEIGNLTELGTLSLANNQLTGTIPSDIGKLTNLSSLSLDNNQLTGAIPSEISNLTSLVRLYLFDNQLTGSIPSEIGDLSNLEQLYLSNNQLTGSVPPEIGNLINLVSMRLFNNHFISIPDLSSLSTLTYLKVSDNHLTFEDIEPNIGVASTFIYAPQDSVGEQQYITVNQSESLTVSVSVGGANNQYQWKKDGNVITGATAYFYAINSAVSGDAGTYTCEITNTIAAELTLYSRQILVEILPKNILVIVPNGGESWKVGTTHNISWTSTNISNVKIEYSADNGSNWIEIAASIDASTGNYEWTVSSAPSDQCLIKITDTNNISISDQSDNLFTITSNSDPLKVIFGGRIKAGSSDLFMEGISPSVTVADWNVDGFDDLILSSYSMHTSEELGPYIYVYLNNGTENNPAFNDSFILTSNNSNIYTGRSTPSMTAILWDWNNDSLKDLVLGTNNQLRVYFNVGTEESPIYGDYITIEDNDGIISSLTYLHPNITDWNNDGLFDLIIGKSGQLNSAYVYLFINTGILGNPVFEAGSQLSSAAGVIHETYGNSPFVIDWDQDNIDDLIVRRSDSFVWYKNIGTNTAPILDNAAGISLLDGTTLTNNGRHNCYSIIDWNKDAVVDILAGDYDGYVELYLGVTNDAKLLFITYPVVNESWETYSTKNITWISNNIDTVKLDYSTDGGEIWAEIIASTDASTGSYEWTVPNEPSANCLIRITDVSDSTVKDQSASPFSIIPAPKEGDANNDGEVDIFDVIAVVNYILETDTSQVTHFNAADCAPAPGDGEIDIFDLNQIINWILYPDAVAKIASGEHPNSANVRFNAIERDEQGRMILPVEIQNNSDLLGAQIEIQFNSEMISTENIQLTERSSYMTLASSISENTIQILLYSSSMNSIKSGSGSVIQLLFEHKSDLQTDDIRIENALLADLNNNNVTVDIGNELVFVENEAGPLLFNLGQNYPNPFNPTTEIVYSIASDNHVSLEVFNISGQLVRTLVNEYKPSGNYKVQWDGKDNVGTSLPAGLYLYRLQSGANKDINKMMMIK